MIRCTYKLLTPKDDKMNLIYPPPPVQTRGIDGLLEKFWFTLETGRDKLTDDPSPVKHFTYIKIHLVIHARANLVGRDITPRCAWHVAKCKQYKLPYPTYA